ncbi:phosphatidylserine lipase ABHD16A [Leptinotarsa decemlineata]|uniref:phosphatidylserine lipase ABHD16A n=1 Tax=Leptinotarsa decemlineata TaxID=7539 RepID=UPI000C25464D|nr:protein ABHD16A [Leptinotarsa decemlineata]
MTPFKMIWEIMFTPRLIKIYSPRGETFYQPDTLEKWSDRVIRSLPVLWKIGLYTSPVWIGILYQRGYFEHDRLMILSKLVTSFGIIIVASFIVRAMRRLQKDDYCEFLNSLREAEKNLTPVTKRKLNMYDFEFKAWPVEFKCTEDNSRTQLSLEKKWTSHSLTNFVAELPLKAIAYAAIHTFGIRLIYPGSLGILQMILDQSLLQGRGRLVLEYRGERFKVETADNNFIDTMFMDKRNAAPNGNTLVICCEGNAGFYEIGLAVTPLEAGYSVLGWNHPGFGCSTGIPFPRQEHNAIDAVMSFAINKLGFKEENILIYGWSIGGYSASWAANHYPNIKGVVLDATFDDLLPLAQNHMPNWWGNIVYFAIRSHVNLDVFEQLSKYSGPVLLIRRTEDEVICLREGDISSNRANDLLYKLLRLRYPYVFESSNHPIFKYLEISHRAQEDFLIKHSVDDNLCTSLLQSYISEHSKEYPMKIGETFSLQERNRMGLFLAKKYMKDFKSSHCVNLPADMFEMPWDLTVESDYVFT